MAYNSDILLGRIIKVSGYEGAVAVKVEKIFTENIPQMESVFLEIEGRPVPFFISESEYSGADILKLWFEGYNSVDKISEFTGCRVFLTKDTTSNNQKEPGNQLLTGYQVFTKEDLLLGPITDIISNNGQWLLNVITSKKKNLLIPFHEDLIISIDKKNKIVVLDIPEGLLEIN